ncbi:MAG TPA: MarR family winged helix-turn-helix transcriptional regulator [Marmoricola sp.]|nr:MarR family winged helix-turn-helix transcriptional regulator [Marmoricola sp.]
MTDPRIAGLEVELSLLARHHLHASQHSAERLLDRSGYHLLSRLELGPMNLKQLAEAFSLDPSTVNRQVNALLRAGLLEKAPDPAGAVARVLRPTRHGLDLLHRDRAVLQAQVGRVVGDWDPADVDDLRRLLEQLNTSIEALEGRPWPRA